MNITRMHITKLVLFYLCLMLTACAGQDTRMGDDVRHMQRAQIYDKSAPLDPVDKPIPLQGMKAQIAVDKYLEKGGQKKQINNAINISVGN